MALMIHDGATPTHPSSLHGDIFNILQTSPHTRDWVVFYQKEVSEPDPWIFYDEERDPKVRGPFNIDFIIYIPTYCSVICLKVLGVEDDLEKVKNGLKNAMYALRDQYPDLQGGPLSLVGRIITDRIVSGVASDELVSINAPLDPDELIIVLENIARENLPNHIVPHDDQNFIRAQIAWNELYNELAGVTKKPETIIRSDLETLRPQLLRLTEEQGGILNTLNELTKKQGEILNTLNEETRYVIDGAAGTGKTVLAQELAKRRCEAGNTVALLCSNPNLIRHLEPWAKEISKGNKGEIVAGTPATLPSWTFRNDSTSLARHKQRLKDFPELEDSLKFSYLEKARWPLFVDETIKDLGRGGTFDYLVVDEAQNLCNEVFLRLMDKLLKGGLTKGHFTMFGDFTNQDIVFHPRIEDGRDALDDFIKRLGIVPLVHKTMDFIKRRDKSSDLPERIELELNCRNTHQIATRTAELTVLGSPPLPGAQGPDVEIEFFSGEEWKTRLDHLVCDLKKRGFQPRQIILLVSNVDGFNMDSCGGWKLSNIREASSDDLRWSDIYDFQGLESDVAILVILSTKDQVEIGRSAILPREELLRKTLYTGMSRAKAMLIIVADESYKESFL